MNLKICDQRYQLKKCASHFQIEYTRGEIEIFSQTNFTIISKLLGTLYLKWDFVSGHLEFDLAYSFRMVASSRFSAINPLICSQQLGCGGSLD